MGAALVAAPRGRGREQVGLAGLTEAAWIGLLLGAFALYYLVPWLPVSLALLALCAVLCYVRLPLAVSLVPLAMPFFMLPKHLGHLEFALGETAVVLCCGAYVLRCVMEPAEARNLLRRVVAASPVERAIALLLLAAAVATLAAHYRHVALRQYREVILEPIAYYVLAVVLLRETRGMVRALWALVGAGLLVAVLGLGQYVFRPDTLAGVDWSTGKPRPLHLITSVYGSPNNLGLLLDRAISVAVVLGVAALLLARARRSNALIGTPILAAVAVLAMAAALVLSSSRGGIITAVVVSAGAAYLWYGRRAPRLEIVGLAAVAVGILAVLWKFRHGLSAIARVNVWISALKMGRDHPLFGVGPDNFLYYYFDRQFVDRKNPATLCIPNTIVLPAKHYINPNLSANAWQEPCLSHPHNVVLDAWLSTGLIGLIALAVIVVGFGLLAYRNVQRFKPGLPRAVQVACMAIVVATLGHGLVDNSIFVPDLAVAFWLALAFTANLAALSPPERASTVA